MMKVYCIKYLGLLSLLLIRVTTATAQPTNAPLSAQTNIFTYFTPLAPGMPDGSNLASKAVALLNRDFPNSNTTPRWLRGADGTAFFIRTFLDNTPDNNKVCMCLTGHQVANLFPDGTTPSVGTSLNLYTDIYMSYFGQAVADSHGNSLNHTTKFAKSYLSTAQLLEYVNNGNEDIALVMVDKRELPSAWIGTLGYDFDDGNWTDSKYYTLAHPHYYPQRISDNETVTSMGTNYVELINAAPYAGAPGGSGAPLLMRPTATGTTPVVRGLISKAPDTLYFSDFNGYEYPYGFASTATKIKMLEQAIRKHCWSKKDSLVTATSGSYRISTIKDNQSTTNAYQQNIVITSATALTQSSSAYTETTDNTAASYLHANQCNMSGFTLPTNHPGDNKAWQVTVAAKEVNINGDFSYTASGTSELNLASVVIDDETPSTFAARKLKDSSELAIAVNNEIEKQWNVYPNPSRTGVFNVIAAFKNPTAGQHYNLQVFSSEGRLVYEGRGENGIAHTIDIHHHATGTYFIVIRDNKGNLLFRKSLVSGY